MGYLDPRTKSPCPCSFASATVESPARFAPLGRSAASGFSGLSPARGPAVLKAEINHSQFFSRTGMSLETGAFSPLRRVRSGSRGSMMEPCGWVLSAGFGRCPGRLRRKSEISLADLSSQVQGQPDYCRSSPESRIASPACAIRSSFAWSSQFTLQRSQSERITWPGPA